MTHHQAVVGGVGPTNHMVLVVDLGGEPWIADAGLGEGFLDPLPLVPGPHDFGPFRWTVELEPCGTWWVASHDWCSFPGFRMDEEASPVSAFEPHHRRLATDPESPFVKTLVVQRPREDRIDDAPGADVVGRSGRTWTASGWWPTRRSSTPCWRASSA